MEITVIFACLFGLTGAIYYIVGDGVNHGKTAKNLDLTVDGFFKAMGIATICIGVLTLAPVINGESMSILKTTYAVTSEDGIEGVELVDLGDVEQSETQVQNEAGMTSSIYSDGVFTGVGRGFKSNISVEVEVVSGEITRVEVVDHRDDQKWFNRANRVIPGNIISVQNADVDSVSGATYTSLGIIEGAQNALSQSRGE